MIKLFKLFQISGYFIYFYYPSTLYILKMSEFIMGDQLQSEDINEGPCTQHDISHDASHACREQLQLLPARQEGEINEDFCTQHGISYHSADYCRDQLQLFNNLLLCQQLITIQINMLQCLEGY